MSGAKGGAGGGEDESAVTKHAVERWNLIIAHKSDKAWDYLTPGYRATKSRESYAEEMNNRGVRWSKVTFSSQECDADTCKVHLLLDYNLDMGGFAGKVASAAPVLETWVKLQGHWYLLPEQFQPTKLGKDS